MVEGSKTQIKSRRRILTVNVTGDRAPSGHYVGSALLDRLNPLLLFSFFCLVPIEVGCQRVPQEEKAQPDSLANDQPVKKETTTGSKKNAADTIAPIKTFDDKTEVVEMARKVSPDELKRICELPRLRTLILDGGGVSPTQFEMLMSLTHLEHIRVRNFAASDQHIQKLVQLRKLKIVNFPQADFSDEAIRRLAKLPELQLLRFASPKVTDKGIGNLSHCNSLRALHLIRVPVTNQSVQSFCEIKSLESLYLDGTKLDDDGFAEILKLRPDIHLHVDQIHLDYDPNKHEHSEQPADTGIGQ